MKYIVAIIQPDRLNEVLWRLEENQIHLLTVTHVQGRGRERVSSKIYREHMEVYALRDKVRLDIAVNDEFVKPAVEAIKYGARSGKIGDGKIFVLDLLESHRIRTDETGPVAIG